MGVYKWKDGARFSADADKVAGELLSLPERTPHAALQYAENEDTELHKCATWDDAKAAHMYRLEEMRLVIRSIIIDDTAPDRAPIEYRAFEYVTIQPESDEEKPRKQFMPTPEALSDKDYRSQVLSEIKIGIAELSQKTKMYLYLADELDTAQQHLAAAQEAITV